MLLFVTERVRKRVNMNPCQNCGKLNTPETNFCRFCGTKFLLVQHQPLNDSPYDYSSPRPYAWKTDEFQTGNEVRRTLPIDNTRPQTEPFAQVDQNFRPAPLTYQQPQHLNQPSHRGCNPRASWAGLLSFFPQAVAAYRENPERHTFDIHWLSGPTRCCLAAR